VELKKVRTLYACVGEHETELSFEPNAIITSVRPSLEPGWLEGNLEGKVGLVPENYVEFLSWSRGAATFGLIAKQNIKDLKFQDWIF